MPKNPSDLESGSFSQCSFFPRKERALAQRSVRVLSGRKKSKGKGMQLRDTFFLFPILSFSCKRKNGRRKKNAIQDRFALFHSAAFGGTCGGLLRNDACMAIIRRRADDIRPYEHDPTSEHECRGAACCSRFFADRPGGMLIPPAPRPSPPWWARRTARCGQPPGSPPERRGPG